MSRSIAKENLGVPVNYGKRRTQLVRSKRHELGFGLIYFFQVGYILFGPQKTYKIAVPAEHRRNAGNDRINFAVFSPVFYFAGMRLAFVLYRAPQAFVKTLIHKPAPQSRSRAPHFLEGISRDALGGFVAVNYRALDVGKDYVIRRVFDSQPVKVGIRQDLLVYNRQPPIQRGRRELLAPH